MFLFLFNFFPPQKVAKSANISVLYIINIYKVIPYVFGYTSKNAVLLLLWVIPKGTSFGRPERTPFGRKKKWGCVPLRARFAVGKAPIIN